MSTYLNGIDLSNNDNPVKLTLDNAWRSDEGDWSTKDEDYKLAQPQAFDANGWLGTLVLIQNGDGEGNDEIIDGHVLNGDHNQYYSTSDYDLIAAIWKGTDGIALDGSQILLNLVDASYLKGQALMQNRIASITQMNSAIDSNWNFLDRFASMADECGGWGTFANIGYSRSTIDDNTGNYNSTSKVKTRGMNAMAGLHYRSANVQHGGMFAALYFDGGWGKYDAYDVFDLTGKAGNIHRSHGKGDVNYYGLGLYAKKEFPVGLNLMAAARFGRADTDYKNNDFNYSNIVNQDTSVSSGWGNDTDIKSLYYGASVGASWDVEFGRSEFTPFATFHWTRQKGKKNLNPWTSTTTHDNVTTVYRTKADMDSIDSQRLQLGARYSYSFTCTPAGGGLKGYVGAAWEHEFDGKATGDMRYGVNPEKHRIKNDTLRGSSGVGYVGLRYEAGSRWYFDATAYGSIGKRESWGGNVGVGFSF